MLEQHPVPQNVTSFQFRLIGDMTLKQFGYLAGGAVLAYVAYKLPLPFFFTWPLAAIFGLGGIGFAFVPVEQRPMDVWFLSFIKSVYSPTLYIWQREPRVATTTTQQGSTSLFPFLSLPTFSKPATSLPTSGLTNSQSVTPSSPSQAKNIWQTFFAKKKQETSQPHHTSPVVLASTPIPSTKPLPTPPSNISTTPTLHPTQQTPPPPNHSTNEPSGAQTPPQQPEPSLTNQQVSTETRELASSVPHPLEKKLQEALEDKKRLEEELASIKQMLMAQQQPQPQQHKQEEKPYIPQTTQRSYPNVISGIVRGQTGELLHSILVTVKDKDDVPLRALKTNKMGQFASSTPLPNGTYAIEVEDPKGMFFFQPVSITLTGTSIDPVTVVAKTKQDLDRQKLADALFGKKE